MYYDSKSELVKYIKFETEDENIEIITDLGVYEVNFYNSDRDEQVEKIWDIIEGNNELILGIKTYG